MYCFGLLSPFIVISKLNSAAVLFDIQCIIVYWGLHLSLKRKQKCQSYNLERVLC